MAAGVRAPGDAHLAADDALDLDAGGRTYPIEVVTAGSFVRAVTIVTARRLAAGAPFGIGVLHGGRAVAHRLAAADRKIELMAGGAKEGIAQGRLFADE